MRIIQVMDAIDFGDGVSNSVINTYKYLKNMGYKTQIFSKWHNERVQEYFNPIEKLFPDKEDIILYHYSGYSHIADILTNYNCKKVLIYHNITPDKFFTNNSNAYLNSKKGLEQLKLIIKDIDVFVADSEFNKQDLLELGVGDCDVLPIVIDFEHMNKCEIDKELFEKYKDINIILFTGRVAQNKKHEDIIDIFEYYYNYINDKILLFLVGNNEYSQEYTQALMDKLEKLNCKNNVVFTGKVSESQLYTYYRVANVFLCMSEHEGFCIPLIEAMNFEIPIIAFDSCAVPYTIEDSGVLVKEKKIADIAELIDILIGNIEIRNEIISKQNTRVENLKEIAIKQILKSLIEKWSQEEIGK